MILNIKHRNKPIRTAISLPGDKSIAQRAIILAAIAEGKSILRNVPLSDDCLAVIRCMRQLGVEVKVRLPRGAKAPLAMTGVVTIKGRGLYGLRKPFKHLNVGESGTAARLLTGLLAGQRFPSVITGKKTLLARPMKRVIEPLCLMGAKIKSKGGRLPIRIYPATLKGIKYTMPVASAQVKSAILFAGLYADGQTIVREKIPTRDHTERLLNLFTAKTQRLQPPFNPPLLRGTKSIVLVSSCLRGKSLNPVNIEIPGDFSSAAYFIAAGLLVPGSKIVIKNVGLNPYRIGLFNVLKRMGAKLSRIPHRASRIPNAEPVGDITVEYSHLKGVNVSKGIIPSLIDEIPILALIATQAKGTTVIKGAGELRVKESDRIKAIVTELSQLGANIKETPGGMIIKGPTRLYGATCASHNDHRMAMMLAIAGLISEGRTKISGFEVVNKSFPSFADNGILK
ncbi:MAG: 3-phosphoshikimate 1-carboxyvinyltransferase [Planctomycetota bacterium]